VLVTCLALTAASLAATTPEQPGSSASGSGMLPAPARTPASRPGTLAPGSGRARTGPRGRAPSRRDRAAGAPGREAALPTARRREPSPGAEGKHGRRDPRRVLVRFRPGTSAAERTAFRRETGATLEHRLGPENEQLSRVVDEVA